MGYVRAAVPTCARVPLVRLAEGRRIREALDVNADAFAILLACSVFVLGVALGLYLATTRFDPIAKGAPVSARRMRRLWVVDPLLDEPVRKVDP